MDIEAYLQTFDLMPYFKLATFIGMVLCALDGIITVYRDRTRTFYPYRIGYILVCCALAWCFVFSENQGWQPWPPLVALIAALDFLLLMLLMRHFEIAKLDGRKA